MDENDQRKLHRSEVVLIIIAVMGLILVVWVAWIRPAYKKTPVVDSYQACVKAGNPIQESYPSVCVTKQGRRFLNTSEHM